MLETLRSWLNGTREYYTGVALFNILCDNPELRAFYALGKTTETYKSLQAELKSICETLKEKQHGSKKTAEQKEQRNSIVHTSKETGSPSEKVSFESDSDLYTSCKRAADDVYKEAMNKRAVLFSTVPENEMEDPNRQDLVAGRCKLAVDVVSLYNNASRLYEKADFVKRHGRLPGDIEPSGEKYEDLADHQVKQALDNLRKNILKIQKREQTPERITLLLKHNADYAKLNDRWLSLKLKL